MLYPIIIQVPRWWVMCETLVSKRGCELDAVIVLNQAEPHLDDVSILCTLISATFPYRLYYWKIITSSPENGWSNDFLRRSADLLYWYWYSILFSISSLPMSVGAVLFSVKADFLSDDCTKGRVLSMQCCIASSLRANMWDALLYDTPSRMCRLGPFPPTCLVIYHAMARPLGPQDGQGQSTLGTTGLSIPERSASPIAADAAIFRAVVLDADCTVFVFLCGSRVTVW